ncbi:uncharacterized protein LOC133477587 [Phyllopteryx taeniolatus]|uniref:uncharacterized protein LOC133477587 n=1 Tax=Phyllopteryx taeniolatus TaxID=161469 RepID=UPI002AD4AD2E|nr:uncharacterized protein LOC133477587 [Phyllopteryx taeniolatus]
MIFPKVRSTEIYHKSALVLLQKRTNSDCNGQSKLLKGLSLPPCPPLRTCTLPELACKILSDPPHPGHRLFWLLPSAHRLDSKHIFCVQSAARQLTAAMIRVVPLRRNGLRRVSGQRSYPGAKETEG